jgi:DNA-binding IclR family transcriptional regulator
LNLLYVKRMQTPESPAMSLTELEDLLGCPREHLEFPLWYLREQGWVARSDNARFAITAKGVDEAEKIEASSDAPQLFLPMPEGEPEAAA